MTAPAALARVQHLHPAAHAEVIAELDREGLLDSAEGGNGGEIRAQSFTDARRCAAVSTMQAASADPRNKEMLRIIHANAHRLGVGELFEDASKVIDVHALNRALRKAPLADRWRFKEACFALRLIPA